MTIGEILQRLNGVRRCGAGFTALCPAHEDRRQSLSVKEVGGTGRILLKCHAGCSCENIVSALGLKMSDLFEDKPPHGEIRPRREKVAEYFYKDLTNRVVCSKVRYSDKSFCWYHPTADGSHRAAGRGGVPAPLYNQFDALACETVFCVEGEKDVETLRRYNIPAVSLPDGANTKWQEDYTEWFRCRKVYIISDNDDVGRQCAEMTAEHISGAAEVVRVLDLSLVWKEIPPHGDVSDLLAAFPDEGVNMLTDLVNHTVNWTDSKAVSDGDDNAVICEEGCQPPLPPASNDWEGGMTADDKLTIINLSEVESTETKWLWYPYIPRGKITLLTADPGSGKTFFALYLAAQVSAGRPFFGTGEAWREREKAVYQTAEDGVSDTIRPRLEPMNPVFSNIVMIDETEQGLDLSDERIERIMRVYKPALMVFDPLQAYLGADVDMHRANEVRPVLAHLAKLAEAYGTAVILIMHNSKTAQNKALYRALGSIDIPAVARSMLIMGRDPDDENCRVICHEKSSLAPRGRSLLFKIKPETVGVEFIGYSELSADDILTSFTEGRRRPAVKQEEAAQMLTALLGEKGWCSYDEVKRLAEEQGVSLGTLKNAKKALQLKTTRMGYAQQETYWLKEEIKPEDIKQAGEETTRTFNP